jgi:hypothetical protein
MPDIYGRLTPEDNAKIQQWWVGRWKAPVVCPVCKTSEWSVNAHIVNVLRYATDAYSPTASTYPHVMVTCKLCAHAMFFNAVQIGLVSVYQEPGPLTSLPPALTGGRSG